MRLTLSPGNAVQKIGATGMSVVAIELLVFNLRHQVFVNTLRFIDFDKEIGIFDVIKTGAQSW